MRQEPLKTNVVAKSAKIFTVYLVVTETCGPCHHDSETDKSNFFPDGLRGLAGLSLRSVDLALASEMCQMHPGCKSHQEPYVKRLLWIVNHQTLMRAEVPILRSLGWEIFIPKIIPDHDPGYRSAVVSYDCDELLGLPEATLRVLNEHEFYEQNWSATVQDILNKYFLALVTHFSYYITPLSEAAGKFKGKIIARAFGREYPRRYTEFVELGLRRDLLGRLDRLGGRFVFGQGYSNLAEIEAPTLQRAAHTITVPLPAEKYAVADRWHGGGNAAILLCPAINTGEESAFYSQIYRSIKRDFGDLPHLIFGRQVLPIDDPSVLPYLSDDELTQLYASAPVFVYPHSEMRHVHYSPIEAVIVGTPLLFYQQSLLGTLAGGTKLPGACGTVAEMFDKAKRLIAGDMELAKAIRASQHVLLDSFSSDLARQQWAEILNARPP
jgi:hypothetical protein